MLAGAVVFLFRFAQRIPPGLEFIGEFDFSCHRRNITYKECLVKEMGGPIQAVLLLEWAVFLRSSVTIRSNPWPVFLKSPVEFEVGLKLLSGCAS
jgi:hypothetical protein